MDTLESSVRLTGMSVGHPHASMEGPVTTEWLLSTARVLMDTLVCLTYVCENTAQCRSS
jgi:hypothetical protein